MVEDISNIIRNGYETYKKNLNLSIPFVLNAVVTTFLAAIILGFGFFYILGPSLSSLKDATSPEAIISTILPVIAQHFFEMVLVVIVYFLISLLFQSFFMAGAIGMAQKATGTGKCGLSNMIETGKRSIINLYLAEVLVGLLSLAGIIFVVPGAAGIDSNQFLSEANAGAVLLLIAGVFLWMIYILVLGLALAVSSYALVMENLAPVDGIIAGFRFFRSHKSDVFMLWLIIGVIVIALAVINMIFGSIPVLSTIWPVVNAIISALIIPPLTTLWWVRLYMTRTGRSVYFNDLLAHPNDLARQGPNQ